MKATKTLALAALAFAGSLAGSLRAQAPLILLNSNADERLRLEQLTGKSTGSGYLLRSASSLAAQPDANRFSATLSLPELRAVRNSGLPYSLNDGPLWAGRGWNESATAALIVRAPHLLAIVAPTLVSSDNETFQVIPYSQSSATPRSVWANPFHPPPNSIDLPLRFGDRRLQRLDPGQSSVTVAAGVVSFGAATENLWWGPGIQNAITLSNNAPGFPHAFLRLTQPIHTRAGTFDAQWIAGRLTESAFFDTTASNDHRSLAGIAATWTTPFDTTLTLGVARLVMSTSDNPLASAFDVFRSVGHLDVDTLAPLPSTARDQITSFFARWLFATGFEAYVEWARFEEPLSLRDLLEYPGHSEGYTLGGQWARPFASGRVFRLQTEASYLEPDPSQRLRTVAMTYTSRGVPQGFTNRGQTLGAAIGPAGSSQWIAGDMFAPRWRIGAHLARIRWDNGPLYEDLVPELKRQDVSLLAGVRGGVEWRGCDLLVDFTHATRFNYLYQAYLTGVGTNTAGIDLVNNTLSVSLSVPVISR